MSPLPQGVLASVEQAHSVTIDAHKWFVTTMGWGVFKLRDALLLSAPLGMTADFMPSNNLLGLRLFLARVGMAMPTM